MNTVLSSAPEKANNKSNFIRLQGKFSVPMEFYNFSYELAEMAIENMKPGKTQTLKEIVGEEFWEENFLDSGQSWWIGRCVAHMVANDLLPLKFAGRKSNHSLLYELK